MSTDVHYAYSVARIRTIENKLLDKAKLERMIESKTPDEAVKILLEAGYGDSSIAAGSVNDYEKLLKEEEKKIFKLLKDIAPEPQIFDIFLYKNDYHNLKVILKSEFLGQENEELLLETGSISAARLKIMVRERRLGELHPITRKAVLEAVELFNRTGDPQNIDFILDKACFLQMKEMAVGANNKWISGLLEILIDLNNIKTFLRIKRLNRSWDFAQKVLLDGGKLSIKFFVDKLNSPIESFIEVLRFTSYSAACEEGIGNFQSTGSLSKLEKLIDNFIMEYIKKTKLVFLGVEPLIGYLIAKETEIKNARIIMVGKMNQISSEIIRERLREAYV